MERSLWTSELDPGDTFVLPASLRIEGAVTTDPPLPAFGIEQWTFDIGVFNGSAVQHIQIRRSL